MKNYFNSSSKISGAALIIVASALAAKGEVDSAYKFAFLGSLLIGGKMAGSVFQDVGVAKTIQGKTEKHPKQPIIA